MLKFLTHKLRTHSLNEESVSEKVEERDSGTESDDEAARPDTSDICADVIMKWNDVTDISMADETCACVPRLLAAPDADQLYDQHSSEEELEVINGAPAAESAGVGGATGAGAAATGAGGVGAGAAPESRRRGASSPPPSAPEKRKWHALSYLDADDAAALAPFSDDDDTKVETPVRFRTSPPLEALKPRRARASPPQLAHSPRRRRAPFSAPARRHRPALDFDKMQQLKVGGGVHSWRQVGGAGGELSVFCW